MTKRFCGMLILAVALPALAVKPRTPQATAGEEFFIVSSVDAKKKQLVLKLPTEVTELAQVTPKTVLQDEDNRPLHFTDLRAGDTVYITFLPSTAGVRVVSRIRKGPMTREELRRRYLHFKQD